MSATQPACTTEEHEAERPPLVRYSTSELHWYQTLGWARSNARRQSLRRRGMPFVIVTKPALGFAAIRAASVGRYDLGDDCTVVERVTT